MLQSPEGEKHDKNVYFSYNKVQRDIFVKISNRAVSIFLRGISIVEIE